jgi:osmotically-inducible protein OsmY
MKLIKVIQVLLIIFTVKLLSGCMDAAITGAQAAYNHDHLQKTFTDQHITTQANRKIYRDSTRFDDTNISIDTFHQEVLITGQIPTAQQREEVTQIIKNIPNVKKVHNLTETRARTSTSTHLHDTWITTKIKAQLIAMNDIDPNEIKVVTENSTVFLMGMVFTDQANSAIDVARNTDGVQNVIKLFTYLHVSNS